jgi:hypothetical protein
VELTWPPAVKPTIAGLKDTVTPEGANCDVRFTFPENLLTLASIVVKVPDEPRLKVMKVGLTDMEKSGDGMKMKTAVE